MSQRKVHSWFLYDKGSTSFAFGPKLPQRYKPFPKPVSEGGGSGLAGHSGPVCCSLPPVTGDWPGCVGVLGPACPMVVCGAGGPEGRWETTVNLLAFCVWPLACGVP